MTHRGSSDFKFKFWSRVSRRGWGEIQMWEVHLARLFLWMSQIRSISQVVLTTSDQDQSIKSLLDICWESLQYCTRVTLQPWRALQCWHTQALFNNASVHFFMQIINSKPYFTLSPSRSSLWCTCWCLVCSICFIPEALKCCSQYKHRSRQPPAFRARVNLWCWRKTLGCRLP